MSRPELARNSKRRNSADNRLVFPKESAFPHSMLLNFTKYEYNSLFNREDGRDSEGNATRSGRIAPSGGSEKVFANPSGSVELPFPKQLQDETSLDTGSFERGAFQGAFIQNLKNAAEGDGESQILNSIASMGKLGYNVGNALGSGDSAALEKIKSDLTKSLGGATTDAKAIGTYLLQKYAPDDMGRGISNAEGFTTNARETMAFNGVNLKSHTFTWELMPSSKAESDEIKKIVNFIKRRILPETQDATSTVPRAFLKYPDIVEIYLLGVNKDYFFEFKPCMVTGFNVSYGSGDNMPIMEGGKPGMVFLELSCTEMQIHTAEDIQG